MVGERVLRHRESVRFRITALATVLVLVVLAITAVALVAVLRNSLIAGADMALERRADEIGSMIERDVDPQVAVGVETDDDALVQIVGSEDAREPAAVLGATANITGLTAVAPAPSGRQTIRTMENPLDDEAPLRILSRRIDGGPGETLHVGVTLDDVSETVTVLATSLVVAVPVAAALLAALVWVLVGRTLRPVESIRTEVASIGGSDLDRRVPVPGTDDEIALLAGTMNDMLDRIERSTALQRRFVADASHELRSPLTRLRTQLEVQARTDGLNSAAESMSLLDEVVAMQRLVEDLLFLARSDAGDRPTARRIVDLDEVLRSEIEAEQRAAAVGITSALEPVMVRGDEEQLGRAFRNLLENAARHARSSVAASLLTDGDTATVAITDDGPGIEPRHQETVFERFTRVDDARTTGDGGVGLGLAIAKDIIERHGGSVAIDDRYIGGARFVVVLPCVPEKDRTTTFAGPSGRAER